MQMLKQSIKADITFKDNIDEKNRCSTVAPESMIVPPVPYQERGV